MLAETVAAKFDVVSTVLHRDRCKKIIRSELRTRFNEARLKLAQSSPFQAAFDSSGCDPW
jgi:hypothetical protein